MQLALETVDANSNYMMAALNEEKVKLIFNYSITGLTEGKDYNITVSI